MEVGIKLVIDFFLCLCSQRDTHRCVRGLCRYTQRQETAAALGQCRSVIKSRGKTSVFYLPFTVYLWMGEDGRCGGRSWTFSLYLSVDSFLYRGISAQVIPFKLQHQQHPPTISPFPYMHSSLPLSISSSHLDNSIGFSVYSKWIELRRSCWNEPSRLPKCNYA